MDTAVAKAPTKKEVVAREERVTTRCDLINEAADALLEGVAERDMLSKSMDALNSILDRKFEPAARLSPSAIEKARRAHDKYQLTAVDRVLKIVTSAMAVKTRTIQSSSTQTVEATAEEIQAKLGPEKYKRMVALIAGKGKNDG